MNRTCFLEDRIHLTRRIPADDERGEWIRDEEELVEATVESVIGQAAELYAAWPTDAPFYTVVRGMFPDVCPTSIVSEDVHFWINMEGQVKDYGVLPFTGGMMEQPQMVLDLLNTVRSVKNHWQTANTPKVGGS
jgi:hypothetical protein